MYSEDMNFTWFDDHPCVRSTDPKAKSCYRCVRCGIDDGFHPLSCLPGYTIHVDTTRYSGGYWDVCKGHRTTPLVDGHPDHRPCPKCWNPDTDPLFQPIPADAEPVVAAAALPGDLVLCQTQVQRVRWVNDYPPGQHKDSIIHNDYWARQIVTTHAWRWFGHAPGSTYTGAELGAKYLPEGISFEPEQP